MVFHILFLLTSIVTARFLERRKMRAASVAYSTMFIIMFFVLLFTVDIEPVRRVMLNIFGRPVYYGIYNAFSDAVNTPAYGVYMIGGIILTIAVQLAITILFPVRAIVRYFTRKKAYLNRFKKVYTRLVRNVRSLYISYPINQLYCRMLN